MKDYIGAHKFVNLFPKNPTQTMYTRFLKTPHGDITSSFTDSVEAWHKFDRQNKTVYEKLFGEI